MNSPFPCSCFLLNYTGRDVGGKFEITLYGSSSLGTPVKCIIDNFRPLFFIPHDLDIPGLVGMSERKSLEMKALDGTAVDCLYFSTYSAFIDTAKRFRNLGLRIYESDIHPVDRFLMERFVAGGFEIKSAVSVSTQTGVTLYRNPVIRGCEINPVLNVLSINIETNADTCEIYSIACSGKLDRVFIIGDAPDADTIFYLSDEKTLLENFIQHVKNEDPDIIIGWNVVDFDLQIIYQRCGALGIPFDLGRGGVSRVITDQRNQTTVRIPGRVVMDVPLMLRSYFHTFEEYSLNYVASKMLGKSKSITLTSREKIAEINKLFLTDKPALCEYNLLDTKLTKEIFDKAGILPNAVERSKRSGHLLDRTGGSVAAFDYLYLPRLHREGYVAPDCAASQESSEPLPGGFVLEPNPGIYENVLVFDFRSLYPSLIMTFKIDPLGLHIPGENRIQGPEGPSFSRDKHVLPGIIKELMAARAEAKKNKNPYLSQAIKILMNSFYGVLGSPGCRFFSTELSSTITRTGQFIFKTAMEHISSTTPYSVIYGDTDSLFVLLGPGKENEADTIGKTLSAEITSWLSTHLKENFGVDSELLLQYEQHFRHFFMPAVRGAVHGSKKHYCGSVEKGSEKKLVFKGMESARSDWTDLAKDFQYELYLRVFSDKPIEDLILDTVSKVKNGELDEKLIYKKRLRKQVDDYTVNVPPHVQAARLLDSPKYLIKYYITVDGPQPLEKLSSPIDYSHYIEAQLKPIADSILECKGTSFDNVISGQQELLL